MRLPLSSLAALTIMTVPALAQEEITTTHEGIAAPLHGTLEGALGEGEGKGGPVVLIHPGSGPTDRDGNSPLGISAQTYKLLAEGLAERGIASVRIDKRGMFESAAAIPNPNDVTVADYVTDIESWVDTISARTDGACVWLLGHSEGGLHAMAAAAKDPARYCGLLLVASPGRNLADVVRAQIEAAPGAAPLLPQVDDIIARLKEGKSVPASDIHPGLQALFGPQVQSFVGSLFREEPAELIVAHDLPVLILNGREDIQTPDSDAELLAEAREDATLVLLGGVNHVLKLAPEDDRAGNIATYSDPDLPLAPGIVEALAEFVTEAR